MSLTVEQEKFVADLFLIQQKRQQINALEEQRHAAEVALVTQYNVDELNTKRAELESDFKNSTTQLRADIQALEINLTK